MLNTHTASTGLIRSQLAPTHSNPKALHSGTKETVASRQIEVDNHIAEQADSLAPLVDRSSDLEALPNLKKFGQELKVGVIGHPEQKMMDALRTGQKVALSLSAGSAPIIIGMDEQLRLTANGPGVENSLVENSSDQSRLDLHFVSDAGNEVYLSQNNGSQDTNVTLREKQIPGQDWLCLSLKQDSEGTNVSLNSTHNDQGSRADFHSNGSFEASYGNHSRGESFNLSGRSERAGVITTTGHGANMTEKQLGSAMLSQQANITHADNRVSAFLSQF